MYDAVTIEERNKPVLTLVNSGFLNDAFSAASLKGRPTLRVVPTAVPCESSVSEDIESGIEGAWESILSSLTRPLSAEEASPHAREAENPQRLVFQGSLAEVNRFFYKRGWTDGLPVIPPTEEAVSEMLSGTDLARDLVLGKLIVRMGKVTLEKIAVNAVMAGALPTHLPVLIAGVQLLLESEPGFYGFGTYGFSTGSWSPFWVINGPIRRDIHVNSGSGALSPGDIANAAIGRAMGLIIKNLGGIRKGVEDMGVLGNPSKYTLVLGENEEESPWDPLHVEYGLKKEDSAVTLSFPQSYLQHWPFASDDEGILRSICANVVRSQRLNLILTPAHARTLARSGWSKKDIKEFISDYARVPGDQVGGFAAGSGGLFKGRIPIRPTDSVPLMRTPEHIKIIVAGGPGAFIGHLVGGGPSPGRKATQKIALPANWDALVAKYKDLVPNYARY